MTSIIKQIIDIYKILANRTISLNKKYVKLLNLSTQIEIDQVADILAKLSEIKPEDEKIELQELTEKDKLANILLYIRKEKEFLEKEFEQLKQSIAKLTAINDQEKEKLNSIDKDCSKFINFLQKMKLDDLDQVFKKYFK